MLLSVMDINTHGYYYICIGRGASTKQPTPQTKRQRREHPTPHFEMAPWAEITKIANIDRRLLGVGWVDSSRRKKSIAVLKVEWKFLELILSPITPVL